MKKLTPTFQFDNVLQLTPDWLAGHGVRGLIVDMDNTIALHNENTVLPGLHPCRQRAFPSPSCPTMTRVG